MLTIALYHSQHPLLSFKVNECKVKADPEFAITLRDINVIIVGDASQVKTKLERFGKVNVYDLDLKPIKFTEEKRGEINITAEKEEMQEGNGQEVVVSIKDRGSGIDREMTSRLFTKFATKSETGTGLGLFICKSIIEAHGGRIWAQNNTDGRGSTFAFSLPLSKKQEQQPTTSTSERRT